MKLMKTVAYYYSPALCVRDSQNPIRFEMGWLTHPLPQVVLTFIQVPTLSHLGENDRISVNLTGDCFG